MPENFAIPPLPGHAEEVRFFEWHHVAIMLQELRTTVDQLKKQSKTQHQTIMKELKKMAKLTQQDMDAILVEVNDVGTAEDSLVAAVDKLLQEYADAPTEETKVAIMAKLEENKTKMLAAINNIPA